MSTGKKIEKLMEERKVSRYKLSKDTGIPYSTLTQIIGGRTKDPQVSTLEVIAHYFGVSLDYIMFNTPLSIIEETLENSGRTIEELAQETGLTVSYIEKIDEIIPDQDDYEAMDRIAKTLYISPSTLRTALSHQEPPAYEGPNTDAKEDFKDEEFDDEIRLIARDIKKLKPENRALLKSILEKLD